MSISFDGRKTTTFSGLSNDINRNLVDFLACNAEIIKVNCYPDPATIERGAFLDCKNLKTLYLPDTFKMENNQEFTLSADLFKPENAQKLQEMREYLGLNEKVDIRCLSLEKAKNTTPSITK